MKLGQEIDDRTLAVLQVGNWRQSLHKENLVHILGSLAAHDPEDNGALRVADVVQLLEARRIQYIVDCLGYIVHAHFMERKVPVLGLRMCVLHMLPGIRIASDIGHPDIVALLIEQIA